MHGLNVNAGPPFKAVNAWPSTSNSIVSTLPAGCCESAALASSCRDAVPIFPRSNADV
jgi:hypothetical protein